VEALRATERVLNPRPIRDARISQPKRAARYFTARVNMSESHSILILNKYLA